MSAWSSEIVTTQAQLDALLEIRRTVFIDEQKVTEAEEIDAYDCLAVCGESVTHVLGRVAGTPVATARIIWPENQEGAVVHIGRVAVLAPWRGKGLGLQLMRDLHAEIRRRGGIETITLGAQISAMRFYERLGYKARGLVFLDARIEHRWMDLNLKEELL